MFLSEVMGVSLKTENEEGSGKTEQTRGSEGGPLGSAKYFEKAFQKIAATTVADSMTADPVSVQPETGIEEIASFMVDKNFHTLPVVQGENLVGIIGKEDVLRTLMSSAEPK